MANILNLTDGTNTVDFVNSGSDYILLKDGLSLPTPPVKRILGGDTILREGERLQERQYGNREIVIEFKIVAADHDTLISDIRKIQRLLDSAVKTSKEVFGPRVTLNYALKNASETVVFDVLDGELDVGNLASQTVNRDSILLDLTLTLLCQPYARLASPVEISNYLANPGFDWNPGSGGRDATVQSDLTGGRFEIATVPGAFRQSAIAAGIWFNPDSVSGTQILMRAGTTTTGWELVLNGNKLEAAWWDAGSNKHTATGVTVLVTGDYHLASLVLYEEADGGAQSLVLMLDDEVEAIDTLASSGLMRVPAGKFSVGDDGSGGSTFNGKIAGGFVIGKLENQVFPYQIPYLYRYGLRSLYQDSIIDNAYWGLDKLTVHAVWPFDESTPASSMLDQSGNAEHLVPSGSESRAAIIPKPNGWTIGADFDSNTDSGLHSSDRKHGIWSCLFDISSGSATTYIEQIIPVPTKKPTPTDWTITLWIKARVADAQITLWLQDGGGLDGHAIGGDIDDVDVWVQYIVTRAIDGDLTLRLIKLSGSADILIDSVMLTTGEPFGTFAAITKNTGEPYPFIGSRDLRAFPDATKVFWTEIEDIPGDAPAGARIFYKVGGSGAQIPIRMAARFGANPWRQVMFWRLDQFILNNGRNSDYGSSFPNPGIEAEASVTLKSRISAHIPRMFPFPGDQRGSWKAYIGVSSKRDTISFLQQESPLAVISLTGDPIKDTNTSGSTRAHMIDSGIFSWPPEFALQAYRDNKITSAPRGDALNLQDDYLFRFNVVNIADDAETGMIYQYLYILPIGEGFAMTQGNWESSSALTQSLLPAGTIMVSDTIEENTIQSVYTALEVDTPVDDRLVQLSAGASQLIGPGIKLQPNQSGYIAVMMMSEGVNEALNKPFGEYKETEIGILWLEYLPRFLYV